MEGLVCWSIHSWGPEPPGKKQLPWCFHAVKNPKPHGPATCRHSSWQSHVCPAFESSHFRHQTCKWRSVHRIPVPAVGVTWSHLSLARWSPRRCGAEKSYHCALPSSWHTESMSTIKWLLIFVTKFGMICYAAIEYWSTRFWPLLVKNRRQKIVVLNQ